VWELISEGAIDRADVEVRFFGHTQYWLRQEIEQYGLGDVVDQQGNVPREVSVEKQRESQILLLLSWDDPRERGTYTGKVFEYLSARRPILALGGPRGVVSELLERTGAGVHVADLASLKDVLLRYYREFTQAGAVRFGGIDERIREYTHVEMARKFARALDEAC
jgi:hypothetical protein